MSSSPSKQAEALRKKEEAEKAAKEAEREKRLS